MGPTRHYQVILFILLPAIVLSFQACSGGFSASNSNWGGTKNLSGNGEPYGGKLSIAIVASKNFLTTPNSPTEFYRVADQNYCAADATEESGFVERLTWNGAIWRYGSDSCGFSTVAPENIDHRSFNSEFARYEEKVFTTDISPHQKNLMLCRAPSDASAQVDVLIQENSIFPELPKKKALDLNFYTQELDPRLSFSRASQGSYLDVDGQLRFAAPDAPRFEFHDGDMLGLLVEGEAENLVTYSEQLERQNPSLLADQAQSPSGELTAETSKVSAGSDSDLLRGTFANVGANTPYSLSIFLKPDAETKTLTLTMAFRADSPHHLIYDIDTNIVQGGHVTQLANGWLRLAMTRKSPSVATELAYSIKAHAKQAALVSLWGLQLEAFPFSTSYIPSLDAPGIRRSDDIKISDTSWFQSHRGAFILEWRLYDLVPGTDQHFMVSDDRKLLIEKSSQHQLHVQLNFAQVIASPKALAGKFYRSAVSFAEDTVIAVQNGEARQKARSNSGGAGISPISIGHDPAHGEWLYGHIRRIAYWPDPLDMGQMIDMTQASRYNNPYSAIVTLTEENVNSGFQHESTLFSVNPTNEGRTRFSSNVYEFSFTTRANGGAFIHALIDGKLVEEELSCRTVN